MKRKQTVKLLAFAALLIGAMMLSACSNNNSANDTNTDTQNNVTPPADSTNTGNDQSSDGNAANTNGSTGGNASNQPADNAEGGSSDNSSSPSNDGSQTARDLEAMLNLAKDGKVKGIPFAADKNLIDDVEKDWGKSDKTDFAGKGNYATYAKKHAVIGFNKGSQIFDVRSDAPELQKLTLEQIEAALGKAEKVTKNGSDTIYTYKASDSFELRFIISADTGKVDHISVYAPADAVNNMAG
ncbi:YjgB family protein [Paenibacillus montanisoli]|nr:YjgB family protein [Paenibacillus montanisoli]